MSDEQARSEAARKMGRAKTPAKVEAARGNVAKARQIRWSDPEARAKLSQSMRESHARRKAAKEQAQVPPDDKTG